MTQRITSTVSCPHFFNSCHQRATIIEDPDAIRLLYVVTGRSQAWAVGLTNKLDGTNMNFSVCSDCGVSVPWVLIALACIGATASAIGGSRLQRRNEAVSRVAAGALYIVAAAFLLLALKL